METVAIAGTGLIGASFGLALKEAGFKGRVLGVSSPPAIAEALACGAIDRAASLDEAVAEADLVYLSQTIRRIVDTLPLVARSLRPGALVTDAGSTKTAIAAAAKNAGLGSRFLGGHPMAGKETRGAAHASAQLFRGRTWIFTPLAPGQMETPAAAAFAGWVKRIGAIPVVMTPEEHDRVVALTSHLPQLLSTGLAATLAGRLNGEDQLRAGGPGLADMTRLAASSYEIWRDILETNAGPIDEALAACIETLQSLRKGLTAEEVRCVFASGSALAEKVRR